MIKIKKTHNLRTFLPFGLVIFLLIGIIYGKYLVTSDRSFKKVVTKAQEYETTPIKPTEPSFQKAKVKKTLSGQIWFPVGVTLDDNKIKIRNIGKVFRITHVKYNVSSPTNIQ